MREASQRQFSKGQLLAPLVIALMRASRSIGRGSLDDPRIIARDARAVTQHAATVERTIHDAVHTLKRSIESALGHDSSLEQRRDIH
jgi:hypothetical protein